MRHPTQLLPLVTSLLIGCMAALPVENVAPLLSEARQNELAAYAKNRDKDKRVAGVVVQTGMDHVSRLVAEGYGWAPGIVSLSTDQEVTPYPFVVLVDPQVRTGDAVKCIFPSEDVESAARATMGSRIVVRGRFHQYVHDQGRLVLVLYRCALE